MRHQSILSYSNYKRHIQSMPDETRHVMHDREVVANVLKKRHIQTLAASMPQLAYEKLLAENRDIAARNSNIAFYDGGNWFVMCVPSELKNFIGD